MATCTQIEQLHQAYIDGVLGDSQRVILEEHVGTCGSCRDSLRMQQRGNALLFETFVEYRLSRDLTQVVIENLPEMEFPPLDVDGVNLRAKHPMRFRERLVRLVTAAAVVLLFTLGLVIRENWPDPSPPTGAVGMITASQGAATRSDARRETIVKARDEDFIVAKEHFETGSDGSMVLSLAGPTTVKMNRDTSIEILDEHNVNIERGEAYFEVARGHGSFRVFTPTGDVAVYGTSFDVYVTPAVTRVVLAEGTVRVGHNEFSTAFAVLEPGEQVEVMSGIETLTPRPADLEGMLAWTKSLNPDDAAYARFVETIQPPRDDARITADVEFILRNVSGLIIENLLVSWEPLPDVTDFCGYDVLVFTETGEPFFKGHIKGEVFAESGRNEFAFRGINRSATNSRNLYVRIQPECGPSSQEMKIKVEVTGKRK